MSQADAFRSMVAGLQLGPEFAALVAFCEGLAEQIDLFPGRATLWREYRPALERLILAGDVEDGEATVLELMHSALGDAEKPKPAKRRTSGGGSGKGVGATADAVAGTGSGRRSRAAS